jgi:hypothetical protein
MPRGNRSQLAAFNGNSGSRNPIEEGAARGAAAIIHVGCVKQAKIYRWCVSQANVRAHVAFPKSKHSACATHHGATACFTHPTMNNPD